MRRGGGEPQEHLPLTPAVFAILLALADGERHGYGIMQAVAASGEGGMRLGPGTLYGSIKRLLKAGWIEERTGRPEGASDDERRRYYRLTGFGRRVAMAEATRLETLVQRARGSHLLRGPGGVGYDEAR